jgi:hypothetical protein
LGYEVEQRDERLRLTLYWQALRHMSRDYKSFVHVADPATGVPVAQDDAMPHRGGYPTRFWAPGEIVVDHIPINLGGAPPGNYDLALGLYDPASLERLPLLIAGDERPDDRRLVLAEERIAIPGEN